MVGTAVYKRYARYARRRFLTQCASLPFVAGVAAAAEPVAPTDSGPSALPTVPKMPDSELAREVDSLLKLVDPRVLHIHQPLPAEKNAWPLWQQASTVHVGWPEDDEFQLGMDRLRESIEAPADNVVHRIAAWVQQNQEALRLTDEGIARGAVELPGRREAIRFPLAMNENDVARRLSRLKQAASLVQLRRGDVDGAIAEAATILHMGTILFRAECLFVDFLVALAILNTGIGAIYAAATARTASDKQARAAIAALAETVPTIQDLQRAYRVEFCRYFLPGLAGYPSNADHTALATNYVVADLPADFAPKESQAQEYQRLMRLVAALLEGHPNPLDKEATVRLASELYVRSFEEMHKPWLQRDRGRAESLRKELSAWPKEAELDIGALFGGGRHTGQPTDAELARARDALRAVDNVFGKYLIDRAGHSIGDLMVLERHRARVDSARIRIALRVYEKKQGRLPPKLSELRDDHLLPDVPTDPFDGETFKYSPERRVVWCVGADGANRGLVPERQDADAPTFDEDFEQVWRIPTAATAR